MDRPLSAYAAIFDARADIGDPQGIGFREEILPGAFLGALRTSDPVALLNHEPSQILGRSSARTLSVWEDARGLRFTVDLPRTSTGQDVQELSRRGDIRATSFAFRVAPGGEQWSVLGDGTELRVISKFAELFDVSVVTYPSYKETNGTVALGLDPGSRSAWRLDLDRRYRDLNEGEPRRAIVGRPQRFKPATAVSVLERRYLSWPA